ncbi:MAG: hypothetical protein MUE40_03070 [Anaerolineae bacterium]|jgi:pilus assembly protein Flp/PilA|nr:hypothetical protein [Anaerolineae bacterium]
MRRLMHHWKTQERGQGLVEYALILVLVAVVVLAILSILGPQVGNIFSRVTSALRIAGAPPSACTLTLTSGYNNMTLSPSPAILGRSVLVGEGFEWQSGNNVLVYAAYSGPELDPELALFNTKAWTINVVRATGNCAPFPNK